MNQKSGSLILAIAATLFAPLATAQNIATEQAGPAPVGIVEQPCPPPATLSPAARSLLVELFMEPRKLAPADFERLMKDPEFGRFNEANRRLGAQDWPGLCRYRSANETLQSGGELPRVVFLGDSITENWVLADPGFFQGGVVNRGIGGQTTPQMLVRFRADVIALKPQMVHILAGTNDVAGNTGPSTAQDFKNNITSMVEVARANGVRVVLGSIPPAASFSWRPELNPVPQIKALNTWLRDYATKNRVDYIDYYGALAGASGELKPELGNDGVHPNRDGYRVMRKLALERIAPVALPDTRGTGRFPALKEESASLPDHVIYRPTRLNDLGSTKLGLYIFGNGGCSNDGASARLHLLEIASHGYLAIAPGRIRSGPGATVPPTSAGAPSRANESSGAPVIPTPPTRASDLTSALDWALAQNADASSPYYGKIDPNAVAVSGFSCGGLQALQIAADPRVKTVVVMNSGIFNPGSGASIGGMDLSKALLSTLHTPTLYILGGETDIAYSNGMDDFARIDKVPVFMGNLLNAGHGGSYWEPNGGKAAAAVVSWLNWQLRDDRRASKTFKGANCTLCRDSSWAVEKKRID
jgi:lysophospholipase L1-like esterase